MNLFLTYLISAICSNVFQVNSINHEKDGFTSVRVIRNGDSLFTIYTKETKISEISIKAYTPEEITGVIQKGLFMRNIDLKRLIDNFLDSFNDIKFDFVTTINNNEEIERFFSERVQSFSDKMEIVIQNIKMGNIETLNTDLKDIHYYLTLIRSVKESMEKFKIIASLDCKEVRNPNFFEKFNSDYSEYYKIDIILQFKFSTYACDFINCANILYLNKKTINSFNENKTKYEFIIKYDNKFYRSI